MNVSGIDPSIAGCGIARALDDGTVHAASIRTKPQGDDVRARVDRVRFVLDRALEFLPRSGLFLIESPSLGSRSQGLRTERLGLYWLLVDQLSRRGDVIEVSPKTRALYASGNGNADKAAVREAVRAAHPTVRVVDDNAADALALTALGSRYIGRPLEAAELTKKQLAAGDRLRWPDRKDH